MVVATFPNGFCKFKLTPNDLMDEAAGATAVDGEVETDDVGSPGKPFSFAKVSDF